MRVILLLFCCIPSFFFAQIINTERLRLNAKEEGWAGTVTLSANLIQNVKRSTRVGVLAGVEYVKKPHRMLILTQYKLNSIAGSIGQNQGYGHFRYNHDIGKRWVAEGFMQLQFNAVQLMRIRALTGAGPRLRIAESDTFRCFVGSLYMFEYEELNDGLGTVNRDHRQSSYLNVGFRINNQARLDHITYFQPKWADLSDFRVSSETRLQLKISEKLAFRTSFSLTYDSRPPIDLPTTYYSFINSLSLAL